MPLLGEGTEKIRCMTVRVSPHPRTLHEQGGDKRKGALVPEWQDKQNEMDWLRAGKGSLPRLENVSRQKDCEPIGGQSARHEFHQELASGVFHSGPG